MTTSREIEREAEESRAQLSSTLEQLRDRLTPGQIVDEMLTGSGAGARAFVGNLGTTVRDNPLPSLLIGAGVVMMMTGVPSLGLGGSSSRSSGMRSYAEDGRDESRWHHSQDDAFGYPDGSSRGDGLMARAGDMASRAGDEVGDAASRAAEGVKGAVRSVRDTASGMAEVVSDAFQSTGEAASDVGDKAGQFGEEARRYAGRATEQVSGTVRSATRRTRDLGREAQDRMSRMMDEQPLAMGAVGLFIGVVLGALLPSTRVENRLMGDSADRLKETATGYAAEQFDHAREVAGEVVERVRDEAQAQGLSVDAAKEKAKEMAGELGSRVQSVAEKAREAAVQPGVPPTGGEAGRRSPADPVAPPATPGGVSPNVVTPMPPTGGSADRSKGTGI